jgi:hypothetical protein
MPVGTVESIATLPSAVRADEGAWAQPIDRLCVRHVPAGAVSLNVDGRAVVGPLQGFGPLWQKTFRARLSGANVSPAEVVRFWKEHFPRLHPPQNRFFPSLAGVQPGEVVLINATTSGMPVYTGVMVLYADDESFTLMTSQGLPESGWITFSACIEDGEVVAQIQTMARANDPVYEIGFRLFGSAEQDKIWSHVLRSLAAHFGVAATVALHKTLLDPSVQWRQIANIRYNAALHSVLYQVTRPVRRLAARAMPRTWRGRRAG